MTLEEVPPAELEVERADSEHVSDPSRLVGHRALLHARQPAQLVGRQVRRARAVEQEVDAPGRVEGASRPGAKVAAHERRRTLARELGHELPAEGRVLAIEGGRAEGIRQRPDPRHFDVQGRRDARLLRCLFHLVAPHEPGHDASSPAGRPDGPTSGANRGEGEDFRSKPRVPPESSDATVREERHSEGRCDHRAQLPRATPRPTHGSRKMAWLPIRGQMMCASPGWTSSPYWKVARPSGAQAISQTPA